MRNKNGVTSHQSLTYSNAWGASLRWGKVTMHLELLDYGETQING